MKVGLQCLYSTQKLVLRTCRRSIATAGASSDAQATETIPPTTISGKSVKFVKSEKGPRGLKTLVPTELKDAILSGVSLGPPKKDPEVHWALGEGYKIGGTVSEAKSALQKFDKETGIPLWGKNAIPLQIQCFGGHTVISLSHFWLRDNCRCSKCVNQETMQRALDTFSIPESIKPSEVVTEKKGLRVKWANDDHTSLYSWDWLLKHRPGNHIGVPGRLSKENGELNTYKYWGEKIKNHPPSVRYEEIMADDKGVGTWMAKIREYGFCYVDGCPVSPGKTQELLERISFIRTTHYGGFYDFTSDLTMKDTAYTTLALPAHTDTTYFTDPAGLQMFHLLSHTDGEGGASLLVDGFKAAQLLKAQDKTAYKVLAETPITWHASGNEGITITPGKKFPVLNLGEMVDQDRQFLMQVRWNNDDRGVPTLQRRIGGLKRYDLGAEKWYPAARLWNNILKRKDVQYWAQLEPGRPLIFDNWRVLHGRSAFTGKRRICGGYINHDDYISRWRNTNFTREEALAQIL